MQELHLLFAAGQRSSCPLWVFTLRDLLWGWSLTPVHPHYVNECSKKEGVIQLFSQRFFLVAALWFIFCCWMEHKKAMGVMLPWLDRIFDEWVFLFLWDYIFTATILEQAYGKKYKIKRGTCCPAFVIFCYFSVLKGNQIPPSAAHPTSRFQMPFLSPSTKDGRLGGGVVTQDGDNMMRFMDNALSQTASKCINSRFQDVDVSHFSSKERIIKKRKTLAME